MSLLLALQGGGAVNAEVIATVGEATTSAIPQSIAGAALVTDAAGHVVTEGLPETILGGAEIAATASESVAENQPGTIVAGSETQASPTSADAGGVPQAVAGGADVAATARDAVAEGSSQASIDIFIFANALAGTADAPGTLAEIAGAADIAALIGSATVEGLVQTIEASIPDVFVDAFYAAASTGGTSASGSGEAGAAVGDGGGSGGHRGVGAKVLPFPRRETEPTGAVIIAFPSICDGAGTQSEITGEVVTVATAAPVTVSKSRRRVPKEARREAVPVAVPAAPFVVPAPPRIDGYVSGLPSLASAGGQHGLAVCGADVPTLPAVASAESSGVCAVRGRGVVVAGSNVVPFCVKKDQPERLVKALKVR